MSGRQWLSSAIVCSLLLVACGGGGGGAAGTVPSPPDSPGTPAPQPDATAVPTPVVFPAHARDIEWSERHQLLFMSLPSENGPAGNVVVALDPRTNTVVRSHPTGSEPGEMALSDDGQYLYVVIHGASAVQRFRLPGLTPDQEFFLGHEPDSGLPLLANDILVVPGQPDAVVVAMGTNPWITTPNLVRVYDSGTPRPDELGAISGGWCYSMQWNAAGDRLYCAGTSRTDFEFLESELGPNGLRLRRAIRDAFRHFYARIHFSPSTGLIYSDDGTVFDPALGQVRARIDESGAMVPDPLRNRLYFNARTTGGIRGYDASTYAPVLPLAPAAAWATKLVRWGERGLALASPDGVVQIFGGSGSSSFDARIARGTATQRTVGPEVNHMAWDSVRGVLYATVGSGAAQMADSIVVIDPYAAQVIQSRAIGPEPSALAVSEDGQYLFVGMNGDGTVRRLRLPSLDPDLTISLGRDDRGDVYVAGRIRPAPSRPETIAVSRLSPTTRPTEIGGMVVFDGDVPRPLISQSTWVNYFDVEWSEDESKLYSANIYSDFYSLDVTDGGVSLATRQLLFRASGRIRLDRGTGLLYHDAGQVVDPVTARPLGLFRSPRNIGSQRIAVDPAAARVFVLADGPPSFWTQEVTVYDMWRFVPLKVYTISGDYSPIPWDFMQLSPGWFAFRSRQGVHIVELE